VTTASLSLEATPPLWVPVQFLVAAPLFGVAFALTLTIIGPEALFARWTPGLLGASHLLVLGYLAVAMFGALQQMLPVLIGAPVPRAGIVSAVLLGLMIVGTLALGMGLAWAEARAVRIGTVLLLPAVSAFVLSAAVSLLRSQARDATLLAMTLSILALAVATGLGLWLATGHMGAGLPLPRRFTNLHLAWGLIGWVSLLIAAVAVHVVPMFQITPPYPRWFVLAFAPTLFLLLVAHSAIDVIGSGNAFARVAARLLETGLAGMLALFGILTLWLLAHRRRRQRDVTLDFWRLGMAALLAAVALWGIGRLLPTLMPQATLELAIGWLFINGFALSIVNGMLYKIVPFLVWLHLNHALTRAGLRGIRIPTLYDAIPPPRMRAQLLLHVAALALGLAAPWLHWTFYPALAAFGASSAFLFLNLIHALHRYHRASRAIGQAAA
jgi:hypothetical protein